MKMMKQMQWILMTLFIVSVLVVMSYRQDQKRDSQFIPSLPRPIAEEMLLITSAGQTTDTYIIKDIANKLRIHNYFMPQATGLDLEDIKSMAIVVGYSEIGERLHDKTLEDEMNRIQGLLSLAKDQEITVITFYTSGQHQRSKETDQLLKLSAEHSDYIIATEDGDYDHFITIIAEEKDIPITMVDNITDVSEPFASAFR